MSVKWRYLLAVLVLLTTTVWMAVLKYPGKRLSLIACDVGQGDAALVIFGETQILIDGGPDMRVLDCLSEHMPFWDREIELIVLSHPQADHYKGVIEVLRRYTVGAFISSGLDSSSQEYGLLKSIVGGSGIRVINPTSGMVIRLGMIYLDILHPSEEFFSENTKRKISVRDENVLGAYTSARDPNDFSVVLILRLGEFDALFTGDINPKLSDSIAETIKAKGIKEVEYIKIPHHGSKNGVTKKLIDATEPEIAVISVGANNQYGHPHEEIIKILKDKDIRILRTDEMGDVGVISDGERFWLSK